ncbi:PREDICTED: uncharacterized protein LOC108563804 [Nicrophorus vespilloides]|uniref:Uncharacterized protein LOC108563804 n=1 Tax=Nicrophorus vespilloides TaxID=110193 RepID=A0ABM1MU29_NICVS|nr:PREDICTED: uncharacterized protein LOC108563804 [Nicrophorus vespilloides]
MTNYGAATDEELFEQFCEDFATVAGMQGRVAYLLMSIHVANPCILHRFFSYDPSTVLYTNMVYGIGLMLYARPNMRPIGNINRIIFSLLGSLMFNFSSVAVFDHIRERFFRKPFLVTFLGFISGRFFMLHLLAYLYHVDIRSRSRNVPRNSTFDSMYID